MNVSDVVELIGIVCILAAVYAIAYAVVPVSPFLVAGSFLLIVGCLCVLVANRGDG